MESLASDNSPKCVDIKLPDFGNQASEWLVPTVQIISLGMNFVTEGSDRGAKVG